MTCALLAMLVASAASQTAQQFTDATCPDATPVGRHLNELANSSNVLTSDLMQTAQQLVLVYRECEPATTGMRRSRSRVPPAARGRTPSRAASTLTSRWRAPATRRKLLRASATVR